MNPTSLLSYKQNVTINIFTNINTKHNGVYNILIINFITSVDHLILFKNEFNVFY